MTTTFVVTFNVPDVNVTAVLNAWQAVIPKLSGETNVNYVKRIIGILGIQLYRNGQDLLNAQAASIPDPGITTS